MGCLSTVAIESGEVDASVGRTPRSTRRRVQRPKVEVMTQVVAGESPDVAATAAPSSMLLGRGLVCRAGGVSDLAVGGHAGVMDVAEAVLPVAEAPAPVAAAAVTEQHRDDAADPGLMTPTSSPIHSACEVVKGSAEQSVTRSL